MDSTLSEFVGLGGHPMNSCGYYKYKPRGWHQTRGQMSPLCSFQRAEETIEETLVRYSCMKVAGYRGMFGGSQVWIGFS